MKRTACAFLVAGILATNLSAAAPDLEALKRAAIEKIDGRRLLTQQMVDSIYSFAEIGFEETETSAYVTGG